MLDKIMLKEVEVGNLVIFPWPQQKILKVP